MLVHAIVPRTRHDKDDDDSSSDEDDDGMFILTCAIKFQVVI